MNPNDIARLIINTSPEKEANDAVLAARVKNGWGEAEQQADDELRKLYFLQFANLESLYRETANAMHQGILNHIFPLAIAPESLREHCLKKIRVELNTLLDSLEADVKSALAYVEKNK